MKRALLALAGALALLSGCDRAPAHPGVVVLRYASPYPPTHPFSQADIAWMKHVEAASNGRLKIEPFWGGTLMSSDSAILELKHGVADIGQIVPIYSRAGMQAIKAQLGFYAGAETVQEQVAVYRCLEQHYPRLTQEMAGVHVLAIQGGNLPNILTRGRAVTRLDDFRGLRLRTPQEGAALMAELGADPVTMPMGEVYSSLSKGVVDGVVAPTDTLKSLHFAEVAPFLSRFVVPRGAYPSRAISDRAWARLPADLQKVLSDSQPFWEAQISSTLAKGAADGAAFGRKQGQKVVEPAPGEQARLTAAYNARSLKNAEALKSVGVDGPAMFRDAQSYVANLRAGRQAC